MTDKQPEALRLAELLDTRISMWDCEAAAELRRLHEVNAELVEALKWIANINALPTQYQTAAKIVLAKATGEQQ